MSESEWAVSVRADALQSGQQFYFDPEFGGEGEVVTVVSMVNSFGLLDVSVEEYDFPLMFLENQFVRLVTP